MPKVSAVTRLTSHQRLAEALLGQPLATWVAERRAAGKSWRKIAADLSVSTGGAARISRETLRSWYGPDDKGVRV